MESNVCLKLLITLILLASSFAEQQDFEKSSAEIDQKWNDFKVKFDKKYGSASEESLRKRNFMENLEKIETHNKLYDNGLTSYYLGINQFHDMTQSEFAVTTTCSSVGAIFYNTNLTMSEDESRRLPRSINWKARGYVTPVKDQGPCAACWAFSSTGALEAQNVRRTGRLVTLSEQNLIDCSGVIGNNGCTDGAPGKAFAYVGDNGGMNSEASYPYEGVSGTCRYQPNAVAATLDAYSIIRSEVKLQAAVADLGPMSVVIYVSESFKSYAGGIFDDEACNGTIGHAVLVIGYGTDNSTGKDYWMIKNSWGTTWGRDGYILMARNKRMCRIGYYASYPVLNSDLLHPNATHNE